VEELVVVPQVFSGRDRASAHPVPPARLLAPFVATSVLMYTPVGEGKRPTRHPVPLPRECGIWTFERLALRADDVVYAKRLVQVETWGIAILCLGTRRAGFRAKWGIATQTRGYPGGSYRSLPRRFDRTRRPHPAKIWSSKKTSAAPAGPSFRLQDWSKQFGSQRTDRLPEVLRAARNTPGAAHPGHPWGVPDLRSITRCMVGTSRFGAGAGPPSCWDLIVGLWTWQRVLEKTPGPPQLGGADGLACRGGGRPRGGAVDLEGSFGGGDVLRWQGAAR